MTLPVSAEDKAPSRIVSVSASGTVNAAPDLARITTGVSSEAATAREAMDQNNKAMAVLIAGLKSIGVEAKDVQTANVSVEPRYQNASDNKVPRLIGYRVVNQVRITQRAVAKLGETLDKAISLGANTMGGVGFEVSDAETLRDEARRRAMANALRRAQLYASSVGMSVDKVVSIAEGDAVMPGPRPMLGARLAMADMVSIEPGEQSLSVTVHVSWELK